MSVKVVLASQSPRRRELLAKITPHFEVYPSDADETLPQGLAPVQAVQLLAEKKARAVAALQQYSGCCVIGADTMVAIDGRILGKPCDYAGALEMLELLSGRTHTVYTGVAVLAPAGQSITATATEVDFYALSRAQMERYANTDEPYDKAGGYGIQDGGCIFVSGVRGDYFNVMGLPVAGLYRQLCALDVL